MISESIKNKKVNLNIFSNDIIGMFTTLNVKKYRDKFNPKDLKWVLLF